MHEQMGNSLLRVLGKVYDRILSYKVVAIMKVSLMMNNMVSEKVEGV